MPVSKARYDWQIFLGSFLNCSLVLIYYKWVIIVPIKSRALDSYLNYFTFHTYLKVLLALCKHLKRWTFQNLVYIEWVVLELYSRYASLQGDDVSGGRLPRILRSPVLTDDFLVLPPSKKEHPLPHKSEEQQYDDFETIDWVKDIARDRNRHRRIHSNKVRHFLNAPIFSQSPSICLKSLPTLGDPPLPRRNEFCCCTRVDLFETPQSMFNVLFSWVKHAVKL